MGRGLRLSIKLSKGERMSIKRFNHAYENLCDKIYLCDGYSYSETVKSGENPELIRADLLKLKIDIDARMKGFARTIEKHLNMKDE